MELVLNLIWLLVSVAVLVLCSSRSVAGGKRRDRAIAVVALLCVVCLLFPVISMTDDLNSAPALPEAKKFKHLAFAGLVVIALAAWGMFHAVQEKSLTAIQWQSDSSLPPQELFAYSLQHRPPPCSSLS